MYNTDENTKRLFLDGCRQSAVISFHGAAEDIELSESDIISGGLTVNRYCTSGERLEIGSAIAAELTLVLNNAEGKFDDTVFEGAELFVKIGVKGANQQVRYVPMGYFTVDEPPRQLSRITISALDRMVRFDKTVDRSSISLPATVAELTDRICFLCDVPLATDVSALPNGKYTVESLPEDGDLTYRQIISWVCEMTGTCGLIDGDGCLILKWYTGTGEVIDASVRISSNLSEGAVTVTGVRIKAEKDIFLSGTDGYLLNIENNGLIGGDAQSVANALGAALNGFTYTPFSATVLPMPWLCPLDMVTFVDKNGKHRPTIITDITFGLNRNTVLKGKGETTVKNGYASADPLTKQEKAVITALKQQQNGYVDGRAQELQEFNRFISNALGLYESSVKEADGSTKYYLHDREKLEESRVIYTTTSGGIAWTSDGWNGGSPVWRYGATSAGDAFFRRITADHITSGTLQGVKIIADEGEIGGCEIVNGRLSISAANISDKLTASQIDAANLKVDAANISGKLTASQINADGISASGVSISGKIDATSGTLCDLTLTGDLYFGDRKEYYISPNYGDAKYYVSLPGLKINEADGAVFSGRLSAASGTFSGSLCVGSDETQIPFHIGVGSDSAKSPCIYSRSDKFAGMGGLGIISDNYVYIGGDGFSYWGGPDSHDYVTAIRPSVILCAGDNTGDLKSNSAVAYHNYGIRFFYGGESNLRNADGISSYQIASMEILPNYIYMRGTFTGNSSGAIISDRDRKHSISEFDERYDALFDCLKPIKYKYNDGASDRYHSGFIAQDVFDAIGCSRMTASDFAAYIEARDDAGGTVRSLRYEEFIALNTWQIQKLKAQVRALWEQINKNKE